MNTQPFGMLRVTTALAVTMLASVPMIASASSQTHKNNWRNGAILGGVVAGYGLLHHNTTATVIGAAGAAYSANRYEQDRKHQSQRSHYRARYHRYSGSYARGGKKYYTYGGHKYYENLSTGQRHRVW